MRLHGFRKPTKKGTRKKEPKKKKKEKSQKKKAKEKKKMALVSEPIGTSRLVVDDHVAEIVRIVRTRCTRDPEFILREMRDVETVAIERADTEGSVRRILRTIPGIYQMTIRLGARRPKPSSRTYSSITAGKFPSEVNYAGRVFQLDIVFLPWLAKKTAPSCARRT